MTVACMLPLARAHRRLCMCAPPVQGCHCSPVRCICMLCVCVGSCMYVCASVCACVSVCLRACVLVCVFLQQPLSINEATVKRRPLAPFWTSPRSSSQVPAAGGTSEAPPTGWLQHAWLRLWVVGCCAPMRSSHVCLIRLISAQKKMKKNVPILDPIQPDMKRLTHTREASRPLCCSVCCGLTDVAISHCGITSVTSPAVVHPCQRFSTGPDLVKIRCISKFKV